MFIHSQTAMTREAAFVRSLLSVSLAYLVIKECSTGNHVSCGCSNNHLADTQVYNLKNESRYPSSTKNSFTTKAEDYSNTDESVTKLESIEGLTKLTYEYQGRIINSFFLFIYY